MRSRRLVAADKPFSWPVQILYALDYIVIACLVVAMAAIVVIKVLAM